MNVARGKAFYERVIGDALPYRTRDFTKIPENELVNPTFPSLRFIGGRDAIVEFDIYHSEEALFVLQLDYLR